MDRPIFSGRGIMMMMMWWWFTVTTLFWTLAGRQGTFVLASKRDLAPIVPAVPAPRAVSSRDLQTAPPAPSEIFTIPPFVLTFEPAPVPTIFVPFATPPPAPVPVPVPVPLAPLPVPFATPPPVPVPVPVAPVPVPIATIPPVPVPVPVAPVPVPIATIPPVPVPVPVAPVPVPIATIPPVPVPIPVAPVPVTFTPIPAPIPVPVPAPVATIPPLPETLAPIRVIPPVSNPITTELPVTMTLPPALPTVNEVFCLPSDCQTNRQADGSFQKECPQGLQCTLETTQSDYQNRVLVVSYGCLGVNPDPVLAGGIIDLSLLPCSCAAVLAATPCSCQACTGASHQDVLTRVYPPFRISCPNSPYPLGTC